MTSAGSVDYTGAAVATTFTNFESTGQDGCLTGASLVFFAPRWRLLVGASVSPASRT